MISVQKRYVISFLFIVSLLTHQFQFDDIISIEIEQFPVIFFPIWRDTFLAFLYHIGVHWFIHIFFYSFFVLCCAMLWKTDCNSKDQHMYIYTDETPCICNGVSLKYMLRVSFVMKHYDVDTLCSISALCVSWLFFFLLYVHICIHDYSIT